MEQFKQIPNYPDYDISNLGNVRSRRRKTPIILKTRAHVRGYRLIRLYKPNSSEYVDRSLHSLIAETFLGECPDGMCVLHIDGDTTNNVLDNLRYDTLSANQQDRLNHNTYGMKLTPRKVRVIRGLRKCGFKRIRIAEIFSVTPNTVWRICRRDMWANVD